MLVYIKKVWLLQKGRCLLHMSQSIKTINAFDDQKPTFSGCAHILSACNIKNQRNSSHIAGTCMMESRKHLCTAPPTVLDSTKVGRAICSLTTDTAEQQERPIGDASVSSVVRMYSQRAQAKLRESSLSIKPSVPPKLSKVGIPASFFDDDGFRDPTRDKAPRFPVLPDSTKDELVRAPFREGSGNTKLWQGQDHRLLRNRNSFEDTGNGEIAQNSRFGGFQMMRHCRQKYIAPLPLTFAAAELGSECSVTTRRKCISSRSSARPQTGNIGRRTKNRSSMPSRLRLPLLTIEESSEYDLRPRFLSTDVGFDDVDELNDNSNDEEEQIVRFLPELRAPPLVLVSEMTTPSRLLQRDLGSSTSFHGVLQSCTCPPIRQLWNSALDGKAQTMSQLRSPNLPVRRLSNELSS
jgi:hypothetical protein